MTHTTERPGCASPGKHRGWRAVGVTAFLCAAHLAASAHLAYAGINVWTSHGPAGGSVCSVAIDPEKPTTLYAGLCFTGTSDGLFKSTDGSQTWASINGGWPHPWWGVDAIAIDPGASDTVYATPWAYCGVFKTTNGGLTWGAVAQNLFCSEGVTYVLAIDPVVPATVYVGAGDCFRQCAGGAYKSTDGGDTWTALTTGLSRTGVFALAIHPTVPTTLYAGTGEEGVFKSTDGGDTWVNVVNSLPVEELVQAIAIDPATPTTLYAGTHWGAGVFKTTDGGEHWSASGLTNLDVGALAIDPSAPGTVYAGTNGGGVFKSTNSGSTWSTFNTGLTDVHAGTLAIDPLTPGRVYAGTSSGVFAIEQVTACVGDCTLDGTVSVDEVITLVNIALGTANMSACEAGDANGNGKITVDEIVRAVNAALIGCAGGGPRIAGCPVFPADNVWNRRVDTLPVDANSPAYVNTIGATAGLHTDFGSALWDGGPIGIPFITVPGTQPFVSIDFVYGDYREESDPGPYPVPPNAPVEGGSASTGDRHVLVIDTGTCLLYELYYAWPQTNGSWQAGSGAVFDLRSNRLRPAGWTSADAAGFAILPGLVRYDEVASGVVNHALRFTVPRTRNTYVWPARHYASSSTDPTRPPMGQRFRLKASFDVSGFSSMNQVILTALKTYGMFIADNGSSWYLSGAPDERWDNDDLRNLQTRVHGSDFEAVDESSLMVDPNSAQAR